MPRGADTRVRLIDAVIEIARTRGYAHTTTRAVAEQAGVSEATIYRHFPDKFALIIAAIGHVSRDVAAATAALDQRVGQGTVTDNLISPLQMMVSLREEIAPLELAIAIDPELARARAAAIEDGPPPGPVSDLANYVAAEQQLGRVAADVDADTVARILMGVAFSAAMGTGPDVTDAVAVVVHGIAPHT